MCMLIPATLYTRAAAASLLHSQPTIVARTARYHMQINGKCAYAYLYHDQYVSPQGDSPAVYETWYVHANLRRLLCYHWECKVKRRRSHSVVCLSEVRVATDDSTLGTLRLESRNLQSHSHPRHHPHPLDIKMPPKSGKKGGAADKGKNAGEEERPDPLQALVCLSLQRERKKCRVMHRQH